jgi:hypothetical protein
MESEERVDDDLTDSARQPEMQSTATQQKADGAQQDDSLFVVQKRFSSRLKGTDGKDKKRQCSSTFPWCAVVLG